MPPKSRKKLVKARGKKKVGRKRTPTADSVARTAVVMESFALLKETNRLTVTAENHVRSAAEQVRLTHSGEELKPLPAEIALNVGAACQAVRSALRHVDELRNPGGQGELKGTDKALAGLGHVVARISEANATIERSAEFIRLAAVGSSLGELGLNLGAAVEALVAARSRLTEIRGLSKPEEFYPTMPWIPEPKVNAEFDAAGKIVSENPTAPKQ